MKTSGGASRKSALQSRLAAWDDAASQAVTKSGRRSRNWLLYTTAVGSALAMATDAGAEIVQYSGVPPVATVNAGVVAPAYLNFPVGPAEFEIAGVIFPSTFGNVAFGASRNAAILVNSSLGVRNLASGAKISSHGVFGAGLRTVKVAGSFGQFGTFAAGVPGFAGIEFNTASSGASPSIHYGWVELEFGGSPFPNSIEAISWAYDTVPGEAIAAGQTSDQNADPPATPEPGTAALSLLAMGAAGVLAWRRKKAALDIV